MCTGKPLINNFEEVWHNDRQTDGMEAPTTDLQRLMKEHQELYVRHDLMIEKINKFMRDITELGNPPQIQTLDGGVDIHTKAELLLAELGRTNKSVSKLELLEKRIEKLEGKEWNPEDPPQWYKSQLELVKVIDRLVADVEKLKIYLLKSDTWKRIIEGK
jgi:hypothetical protein